MDSLVFHSVASGQNIDAEPSGDVLYVTLWMVRAEKAQCLGILTLKVPCLVMMSLCF